MQTERIHPDQVPTAKRLIDLIESGQVVGVTRFTVDQVETDSGWAMQTLAIGIPAEGTASFPVAVIDQHATDDDAMRYAVSVFETLKAKGLITSQQAARYRRSLITLVPSDPVHL
ncbi:hypothetical protein [Pseudomonas sp.]|uniref:hypothetical protein n=1 Tax=Pseudomonas sp. TaxID=306 RepID=UPI00299E8252|nr:hypothetical protein [Pseudomonas sp.]MDX1366903.1 hypothetical protein [Pseudomonas sp.]